MTTGPNNGIGPGSPEELFGAPRSVPRGGPARVEPTDPSSTGPSPSGPSPSEAGPRQCSRKGCRESADWALLWNNPRIHTPERRKIWLACADHRDWLEEYLSSRGLWKQTVGVDAIPRDAG